MTQNAQVIALLPDGNARVQIERVSACGHDCSTCDGCGLMAAPIEAVAQNPVGAKTGDFVVVESGTKRIFKLALLTYLLPVVLLFLFYVIARLLSGNEWICSFASVFGFLIGLSGAVVSNRAGQVETVIISIREKA